MKTIFFFLPILLITKKFSIAEFGPSNLFLNSHLNYSYLTTDKFWISFAFFIVLAIASYEMEQRILPIAIVLFFKSRISRKIMRFSKPNTEKALNALFGENTLKYFNNTNKIEIYGHFLYIPIVIFLFSAYFNTIAFYLVDIITILIFLFFFMMLNTFYKEYGE